MLDFDNLQAKVRRLQAHKQEWADLPVKNKLTLLKGLRSNLRQEGSRWVEVTTEARKIDPDSAWAGESWIGGPWAFAAGINGLLDSLQSLSAGRIPRPKKIWNRPNGQLVAQVFPANIYDRLLFNDVSMEIWMQPDVNQENLSQHTAVFYQQNKPAGKVALILGAGNVSSIPPLDILHTMYVRGHVSLLKMNPVNDYLGPILERIFVDFIEAGYLAIAYGGADTGAYLVEQPGIETIHITGSAHTYQTIVFGGGSEGLERRRRNEPILAKPITSELGGVTPVIVIPGPWSEADIAYQAQNIVTMKLQNGGYNCIAAQVLILPHNWDRSAALLEAIRELMRNLPQRFPYYPGTADRQQAAISHHPNAEQLSGEVPRSLITNLDPAAKDEFCFREELFGETLAQVSLPGDTPSEYLQNAVTFCNGKLQGTLGANIIVHPKTARLIGPILESAIDDLAYGSVSLNIWAAAAFLLAQAAWGGYPSQSEQKSHSGTGVVHNSFMFDKPQKTVVRASFYPFPRSIRHGDFHISPKPPWFVTHKTAHVTNRRVAWLTADRNPIHLPGIFISTLRG